MSPNDTLRVSRDSLSTWNLYTTPQDVHVETGRGCLVSRRLEFLTYHILRCTLVTQCCTLV